MLHQSLSLGDVFDGHLLVLIQPLSLLLLLFLLPVLSLLLLILIDEAHILTSPSELLLEHETNIVINFGLFTLLTLRQSEKSNGRFDVLL